MMFAFIMTCLMSAQAFAKAQAGEDLQALKSRPSKEQGKEATGQASTPQAEAASYHPPAWRGAPEGCGAQSLLDCT